MSRQDELLAIAAAHAATQAISTIGDDVRDAEQSLQQSLESGDTATAALEMRRLADLASQAQLLQNMTGAGGQPQQAQSQFTPAELDWLQRNPGIASDARKMAELVGAANALLARGYDRNAPEYISALDTFAGNHRNSGEAELTPDGVLEICKSKYGTVTPDQYNQGVNRLLHEKRIGVRK
jgi:hypothetical protein